VGVSERVAPVIATCLKLVHERVEVDPISGSVHVEPRSAGMSPADQAALEWSLRMAEAVGGTVVAVTAGPEGADQVLRAAVAVGATRAVRVELEPGASSAATAAALAEVLCSAAFIFCGDASIDRGTGAVPAYLAGELGAEQALGLVGLELPQGGEPPVVKVARRLDRGRREHLSLSPQCVLSVEAHTSRLRRAPFEAVLAAQGFSIELGQTDPKSVPGAREPVPVPVRTAPWRPRARVVPAPQSSLGPRDRVLALTGMLADRSPARTLRLEPAEAASVLLDTLQAWGELG
jgi:electron transfer flavoprotein beta subunit